MKNSISILVLAMSFMMLFSSCSNEEASLISPEDVLSRIDIVIESNNAEQHYFMQQQPGSSDLLDVLHRSHSSCVDFTISISDNEKLVFSITDQMNSELWTRVGHGYSLFASQDMDDKREWVVSELRKTGGELVGTSHIGEEYPRGTYLDVFKIVEFNPVTNEILCRLENFPLVKLNDNSPMMINGSFRGNVSFLNQ